MQRYEPLNFDGGDGPRVDWESGFRLDDRQIAFGLGRALSARLSDLLDIAMAAYVTDRLRPRRPPGSRGGDHWSRQLPVRIAVRDGEFWRQDDVAEALRDLLEWLTDDVWDFDFLSDRQQHRYAESQEPLFGLELSPDARFGLYSGGLDSYAGAAADASEPGRELVLVAATTSQTMGAMQQRTVAALKACSPAAIRALQVPVALRGQTIARLAGRRDAPEASQRTRGLVFLVLGAVSAATAGARELRVYENGVGAMNLPLTEAQYGSHNTRAMRPETLVKATRLISLVLDDAFAIVNPSFTMTKAQMCARLPAAVRDGIATTVSCDTGLTHRASKVHLCGTCTSCLLRRQALRAGGLAEEDDAEAAAYRTDVREVSASGDKRALRLHYMLNQAAQMDRALREVRPTEALVQTFPDLRRIHDALGAQGYQDPVGLTQALLASYVEEWTGFEHPLTARYLPLGQRTGAAA
jgi:7-cyano-7-deazaguanine synthase in queuosine biosynthesis